MKYPSYCPDCDKNHYKNVGGNFGNCKGCYQNQKTNSIPTHFWRKHKNGVNK